MVKENFSEHIMKIDSRQHPQIQIRRNSFVNTIFKGWHNCLKIRQSKGRFGTQPQNIMDERLTTAIVTSAGFWPSPSVMERAHVGTDERKPRQNKPFFGKS